MSTPTQSTTTSNTIRRLDRALGRDEGVAFRVPDGDGWTDVSYPDLDEDVRRLAAGLVALGLDAGSAVAIYAETSADWVRADLAAIRAGLVVATIYHSSSPEEARHILDNSESVLVFCDGTDTLEKVEQVRGELAGLQHTVLFAGESEGALSLDDLREKGDEALESGGAGDELERRADAVGPDDLVTLVYTSGTTGPPKGCMLTHGNIEAGLDNFGEAVGVDGDASFYIFLPLAHVLTRIFELVALDGGATLGFWRQDMNKIIDDLGELKPTHIAAVPRIFEKIYNKAYERAGDATGQKILSSAVGTSRDVKATERRGGRVGPFQRAGHQLADKVLYGRIRELLGGNVRLALVGAAPVATEMLEFFDACGVLVLEGYGLTETTAVGTLNTPDRFRFGTQGPQAPQAEMKLAPREDSSDDADGSGADGADDADDEGTDPGAEVLLRGPGLFKGYYKQDDETREAIDDEGWFHTGDVGSIDDDGFLTITGRTKDIIVTSSGKNIPAARIENELAQSRWIEHAVLYGDDKNYLTAAVTLDPDELDALAQQAGEESSDQESLASSEAVQAEIDQAVEAANENFARVEQVKKVTILPRSLSTDEGELTSTMKVKRPIVHDNHRDTFEALYE